MLVVNNSIYHQLEVNTKPILCKFDDVMVIQLG